MLYCSDFYNTVKEHELLKFTGQVAKYDIKNKQLFLP